MPAWPTISTSLELLELIAQLFARELLVVDDEDAQRGYVMRVIVFTVRRSSGTSMRARVPLPGSLSSVSW